MYSHELLVTLSRKDEAKMDTYNTYFNDAWEYLKEMHPESKLETVMGEVLDLSKKPPLNKKNWGMYIDRLYTVLSIGIREGFTTPHVNSKGQIVYIKFKGY